LTGEETVDRSPLDWRVIRLRLSEEQRMTYIIDVTSVPEKLLEKLVAILLEDKFSEGVNDAPDILNQAFAFGR
jgi:hypothetical protein